MKRLSKPVIACAVAGSFFLGTAAAGLVYVNAETAEAAAAASQNTDQLVLQDESIVSSGVRMQTYRWTRTKNNQNISTNVIVIKVDLQNPNVKLDVMTGKDGQFAEKASVQTMARATGAIAGINGDYFDMNAAEPAPLGPQVAGETLMATPTLLLQGMYAFGITKQNKPIIETFTSQGIVTAANGLTYELAGLNRVVGTLGNAIYMYTSAWGSETRAKDAAPHTEVLVVDGIVTQIVPNGRIQGLVPENGYILSAGGKGAEFIAANVRVGEPLVAKSYLVPVNPNLTYTADDFKMLIGGHTMLVIDGAKAAYTRDVSGISPNGNTARSAVGFSKDQRYVYIVAADHAGDSVGPTLPDFQSLLIRLGVWRAVNLDGGGSTTVVSRPLGEFQAQLVNVPKEGTQRLVVNGLGVFTTAAPTALKDFILNGPKVLWKGQTASYAVKAYDTNYNPLDPAALTVPVQFKTKGDTLQADPAAVGAITATAGGAGSVVAYSGDVNEAIEVEVIDQRLIQKLEVSPSKSPSNWLPGDNIQLQLKATLSDGRTGTIPAELVKWQQFGARGAISGDTLTFGGFVGGASDAMMLASFDGFKTPLAVPVPFEAPVTDFNNVPWAITPETYPAQAIGSVALTGTDANRMLSLSYDFAAGDGATNLAAYATFNGEAGLPISGKPTGWKLDVFGDGQKGWLRAEFADAEGTIHRKTIASEVDWQGWRAMTVDLKDIDAVSLKRIYLVSKEKIQGELAFDNLSLLYAEQPAQGQPTTVHLTVGKKDVTVAGQPQQLDVAPLIEKDRTFVPVRFIVDALGGHVDWDATDRKVTIRKGGHFIELWVGKTDLIADGTRMQTDVPPILKNGRTMLPLRFVTEQLGLNVAWDSATRGITIVER